MRKILIVEDEELLRDTYNLILSSEPYSISIAADGEEALALCEETVYDLILLDLMMPKVDGVAFLEQYGKKETPMPPVIILSNLSSGDELARALTLGARKNVVKADMSPRQLLSLVRYELQAAA
jgi:DNA-binding response OmpR family regulator